MLNFTNQIVTLVTEFAPAPILDFTFVPPPVLDFSFPVPASLNFTVLPAPVIAFTISAPGLQGPPGAKGTRGSLLLGMYATAAVMPDTEAFNVGDYAFTQDTGELWQIEE